MARRAQSSIGSRRTRARSQAARSRGPSSRSSNGSSSRRLLARTAREDRSQTGGAHSRWSAREDRELKQLIRRSMPARVIGEKLGRTPSAVRQHVHKLGLSLRSAGRSAQHAR